MPYSDPVRQAEYQRSWMAARRRAWFAGKTCAWCGSTDELELDHVDSATKVNHRIWSWSQERREEELAKCQALCRDCHSAKATLLGESPTEKDPYQHGTPAMYDHHKCRCDSCRACNTERHRRWRASKLLSSMG